MRRAAFSLVELIVVIGLITLLLAITVPAVQSSREQAESVLCSSNIRQLLIGLFTYESENQTLPYSLDDTPMKPPPPGGYPTYNQYDRIGWWWFNYIGFYNNADRRKTVILCPSKNLKDTWLKNNVLCGNYAVNLSICKSATGHRSRAEFIGTPLRTTNLRHPGQTLLIVDSGYSMINWWHAADMPPVALSDTIIEDIEDTAYIPGLWINKERDLRPGQEQDAIDGRHPNKTVNVGFSDGHVSHTKADELLVEKTGDTYKNRSPLWLPK